MFAGLVFSAHVNVSWFNCVRTQRDMKCQLKSVKFSDVIQVILEPENLREDLQKARTSDLSQRQADKARRERLLSPILTKSHRKNIFDKLHSD